MASFNRIQPSRSGLFSMSQGEKQKDRDRQKDGDRDRLREGKAGQKERRLTDTHADDHVSCRPAQNRFPRDLEGGGGKAGTGSGLRRVLT